MNKKGVELTFNAIVIASIVLIAMIVVIMIFTNFMSKGKEGLAGISSCQSMGNGRGHCEKETIEGERCIWKYGGCNEEAGGDFCCFPEEESEE